MQSLNLRSFPQVWVADAEFRQVAGERPDVHCVVLRELWSGSVVRLWRDDPPRRTHPPHPIGPGSLFVVYNAMAELACYLTLGWELPCRIVDLLVEFRLITNGSDWREGENSKHKLIHAVECFGMNVIDAVEKSTMQALGIRGQPFSAQERSDLLKYCERDVLVTTELLRRMAPKLTIQALQRGRFMCTAARMLHRGIPLDAEIYDQLKKRREPIIHALVSEVNSTFGVYLLTAL